MRTRYEPAKQEQTNRAHLVARTEIYPVMFGSSLEFEGFAKTNGHRPGDERYSEFMDGRLCIDVVVRTSGLDLPFYVQERFRHPDYESYQDVTFTDMNPTGEPAELHKMAAGYMAYGYFDDETGHFHDWIVFNVPSVFRAIALGRLKLHTVPQNDKGQTVRGLHIQELERYGISSQNGWIS